MSTATGALIGLLGGLGAAAAWAYLPPLRRPTLADRVEPYVQDVTGPAWPAHQPVQAPMQPLSALGRIARPAVDDAARRLGQLLGGTGSVRRRIDAAGLAMTVQAFRIEQVLWGAAGVGGGVALGVLLARGRFADVVVTLVLCVAGAAAGVVARDVALTRTVARRERRLLAELPVVAELLALSVSAGEGPTAALERVARTTHGALADELRRTLAAARAGEPLAQALDAMARRSTVQPLVRFADGLVVALERGTPLADVLRAQADDVREAGRRALIESGGRREVGMLIPVVFGVLPVTVLFALFPAVVGLTVVTP